MKTDPSIYAFLATDPEAFRVLTGGLTLTGEYAFRSLTLKGIERRLDGLYEPRGHDGPAYVVEFQAQPAASAWYNLLTKIGLYGEEHPDRDVQGLLILLQDSDSPRWPSRVGSPDAVAAAVCLERFLPQWLEREPDNPFVAALAPLVLTRDEDLRERASQLWRSIQEAPVAPSVRNALSQILECWLFERFKSLTEEEIWAMLNIFTPLEETRAYQSIFAKGEAKGKAEGEAKGKAEGEAKGKAEGKAEDLKRLLARRFGPLPKWATARIDGATVDQMDAWLDGIFDAPALDALLGSPPRPTRRRKPAG
jgi:predicted transposase YdaD